MTLLNLRFGKGGYFVFQCLLTLVNPFASLIVALIFFRNWISRLFMLVFVVYFGSRFWLGNDATNHYIDMMMWYRGNSIKNILDNRLIFFESREPYSMILKFIVAKISTNPQFFGAVLALIYAVLVMNTCIQLRNYGVDSETKEQHYSMTAMLIFLITMTFIQFFWYQGVRYWPGVFFFTGFYLHYKRTNKPWSLVVACLCPLFHFSLFVFPVALIMHKVMGKMGYWSYVLFFIISWFFRMAHFDIVPYIQNFIPNFANPTGVAENIDFRQELIDYMSVHRLEANAVYSFRTPFLMFVGYSMYFLAAYCKLKFNKVTKHFFLLSTVIFSICNIEFADATFYERFSKIAVLLLWISLTILAYNNQSFCKRKAHVLFFILVPILSFDILTQVVEMRRHLVPELFFGNFFTDYWGGLDQERISFSWLMFFM